MVVFGGTGSIKEFQTRTIADGIIICAEKLCGESDALQGRMPHQHTGSKRPCFRRHRVIRNAINSNGYKPSIGIYQGMSAIANHVVATLK